MLFFATSLGAMMVSATTPGAAGGIYVDGFMNPSYLVLAKENPRPISPLPLCHFVVFVFCLVIVVPHYVPDKGRVLSKF